MGEGLSTGLLFTALVIGAVGFLLIVRQLSVLPALVITLVKLGMPLAYFAWYHDGGWHFIDDITYWMQGQQLLAMGYDPLTVLLRIDGLAMLLTLAGGPHILYVWWNVLAQYLFGPHYYAAVFLNVGLTFLTGALLYRIARMGGFSRQYAQGFLVFTLLHGEILVWSSFINLKDILVTALAVAAIYFFLRLVTGPLSLRGRLFHGAGLLGVLLLFPWLRFYVPFLLMISFVGWGMLKLRGRVKLGLLAGAAAVLLLVVPTTIPTQFLTLHPVSVVGGLVRGPLTPRPWAILPEYSFLTGPAVIHWVLFGPALLGGYLLWRRSRVGALLVIYLLAATFLTALAPEFQGPRHRVQVLFIWAWLQYHVIYSAVAGIVPRRVPAEEVVPEEVVPLHAATAGAGAR